MFADLLPKLRCIGGSSSSPSSSSSSYFVLASQSPRRREILEKLGLPFTIRASTFPENLDHRNYVGRPFDYTLDNSKFKAVEIYRTLIDEEGEPSSNLVVGCDTVVALEGTIYEKPKDEEDAFRILSRLNGRVHEVFTGVTLLRPCEQGSSVDKEPLIDQFYERTEVKFGRLSEQLIRAYISTKEPLDKAGAYGIQGQGAVLIERIDGDFYNVQGFPLYRFTEHLIRLFACGKCKSYGFSFQIHLHSINIKKLIMTIASHAMEIFRQGIWASLTGGWCYDPRQTLACNVVHMYLWLFLFLLPLLITLCFNFTWLVVGIYALIVGVVFSVLKILNYYLHTIFDTHDPIDVVVNENADEEDDDEENGIRDVEEGVVVLDEDNRGGAIVDGLDHRRAQSAIAGTGQGSTLYEALGETSLAASSSGVGVFPDDDEELEYVTWESPQGMVKTILQPGDLPKADSNNQRRGGGGGGDHGRRKKGGAANKKRALSPNIGSPSDQPGPSGVTVGSQLPASPDYLAVEADVHSMPNEPTGEDDILDVDNIELRAVRSDSKLVTNNTTSTTMTNPTSGSGCSTALTTADIEIMPGGDRKNETLSPGGRRIFFQSNDIEIDKRRRNRGVEEDDEEFGDDDNEEEDDNVEEMADDNEHGVASSSSSLSWFKRKYSEPVFVISEQGESSEIKESVDETDESRRDSFDRFGRKRRSGKRGVVVSTNVGGNTVRRTRSTVETNAQRRSTSGRDSADGGGVGAISTSSTLLSETCLEKCRGKGVRKSYPGKTSSTDIFLLQHVGTRKPDGFRESESGSRIGSCGTGLEESGFMAGDEHGDGSHRASCGASEKSGMGNTLGVGRVSRFHSVDVPLTDIPERESESERADGFADGEIPTSIPVRSASIMESSLTTTMTNSLTADPFGTSRSDGRGTTVSFYATASEESPPTARARAGSTEQLPKRGGRRWASSEDHSPQSPRRKLIQNLRDTLETLKSEASGSSTGTTTGQADRFVADLQALKDASTPDLRWLFDDAAAVLTASTSYRHSAGHTSSSAGNSPVSRPRLASLQGQELALPSSSRSDVESGTLPPLALSRVGMPGASASASTEPLSFQQQFRERLMEEIKRLLEEIIDSHPEALEAIESVRQAKLARIAGIGGAGDIRIPPTSCDSYNGEDEDGYVDPNSMTFGADADVPGPSNRGYGGRQSSDEHHHGSHNGRLKRQGFVRQTMMADDLPSESEDAQADDMAAHIAAARVLRGSTESARNALGYGRLDTTGENMALAELARQRNVHVACSHDDTTEGAVHYFQDSDGKWYTYTFNDEGVATAQLLGSDRALMELIAEQQEESDPRHQGRSGRSKSGASTTSGRSRDRRLASRRRQQPTQPTSRNGHRGGQQQRQGPPQPLKIVLARTGSSSSEESFLQLDAPASIMHISGAAGPSGTMSGGVSRTSGAAAAASETPSSGRVALPLRLQRHSSGSGQASVIAATSSAGSGRRRASAARAFPLRQMLNRGGGSVQFPPTTGGGGSLALMPRMDSVGGAGASFNPFPHPHDDLTTPGDYSTIALSSSNFLTLSGSLRTPSDLSHSSFRARFLATLAGGVDGLPSMIGAGGPLGGPGQIISSASSVKRKQYYRVSICPRFSMCCCPNWLTSRLNALKFWGAGSNRSATVGGAGGSLGGTNGWLCCPKRTFKLRLDRLRLMAMFDRNRSKSSAFIDVLLAVLVTFVACGVLSRPLYYDFSFVVVCLVTAGAQFSLMKSVQPDAASPVHGYNSLAAYSRPVYYCLFGMMVYMFDRFYAFHPINPYATETLYSTWPNVWEFWWNGMKDFWATFFLFLPIIFTFGLLPQLNTFVIYLLEQVDMLMFGGTASVGLASSIFSVFRSFLCSTILFVLNYLALHRQTPRPTQNVIFSAFCGSAVGLSYLLSRSSSDPRLLGALLSCLQNSRCWNRAATSSSSGAHRAEDGNEGGDGGNEENDIADRDQNAQRHRQRFHQKSGSTEDPLPGQLRETVIIRTKHDIITSLILGVVYFALHCSTAFTVLRPTLGTVLPSIAVAVGIVCHYLLPQLRQHTPWRVLAAPVLKSYEHRIFDVDSMARLMPFERVYATLNTLEKNVLYPLVVLYLMTASGEELVKRYGILFAAIMMSVASLKLLRTSYCNCAQLYLPLAAAVLFSYVDFPTLSLTVLLDFYLLAMVFPKLIELMLKLQFIFSYVAPWQISWGSAFHAFAQPTAIPHSAFTLAITTISSFLSAPLNPFLGSAVFLMSYVRPVKFWEKNYNTKRVDNSNTRLISQIDRGPMTDDSNLNAIFYEHLTRSLQRSLAGDVQLGRLATTVNSGDCFILASFYLNCLVHVVEVGNGFVTFQLRGLEFRGTYCQQREVEAISEEIGDQGCCCCGGDGRAAAACCCVRGFLSLNAVWNLSWLSWRVTASKFVLEGYSVSDNSALSLLQVIEYRKLLVTLYVKCILFYALKSTKLDDWMCMEAVVAALEPVTKDAKYVDVDPSFCAANDDDYDCRLNGISRQSFCQHYLPWIEYCYGRKRRPKHQSSEEGDRNGGACEKDSLLTALCYGLALVGRRVLGAAAQGRHTSGAESFLYGLHALFKGDFRITCSRDEWVFADMDILKSVIAPAVRMALKLHQDHFTAPDDFESMEFLFDSIDHYDRTIFISHENDPAWRHAVLTNTRSLLALRHVFEDGQDDFKIIMLNRRHMNFRIIALNKECVRAFWAGQQQELIFLRNRNPERGSIQNAKQVLRNMINSSADQPIGYPIYVSPLTTSFCETHEQIAKCTGPPLSLNLIGRWCAQAWRRLTARCGTSGSSNLTSTGLGTSSTNQPPAAGLVHFRSPSHGFGGGQGGMAETSLTERRHMEPRHSSSSSRTRPIPRPRMSLLNTTAPPAMGRRGDSPIPGRASLIPGRGASSSTRRPPLPPPRHGSAPPIMQRSMTHPLRATSLSSHFFRHHARTEGHYPPRSPSGMTPSRSRESLAALRASTTVATPRNSVVAASGDQPRVSLGSLLALNVDEEQQHIGAGASTSSTNGGGNRRRGERVRIADPSAVLENLDRNLSLMTRTPVVWPTEEWRRRGGRLSWKSWKPEKGMEGSVVHKWSPWHADPKRRSHLDKIILLVNILDGKYFVPILEQGVEFVGDEL